MEHLSSWEPNDEDDTNNDYTDDNQDINCKTTEKTYTIVNN